MAINLTNLNNRSLQLDQARSTQQKANVSGDNATQTSPQRIAQGDSVNITSQAKSLTAMEHDLAQGTPVNESKVESLKKAIADGSYQVDANKLAKNMSNFETLLA
ncbi:flagellar biosynthesis anti-sigma factor FlgM [Moritella marina ATCC 15381]|uniref:Negative regulator of flagellin synthesis n=1 Tax=Moritella marina ATCC 15381 TaxID=1202962 RepID=A0A5J6WIF1_MORMI|nr:flagellar biosynthesis anti-sigma factor FlgM [Moritella marina]QFI36555.1 flagellar biosynthesis anti-sigma factor FlgM [Moritella marina ATCC 15381]